VFMTIAEMKPDELTALIGLAKFVIMSDRILTPEERLKFDAIIEKIGPEKFRELLDKFDTCCPDEDSFRQFLKKIVSQEARESIFRIVFDLATVDSVDPIESDMLDWLAGEWDIRIGIESEDDSE